MPSSRRAWTRAAARSPRCSSRTARCIRATSSSPARPSAACASMTNDKGQKVNEAGPSVPVEITGLGRSPRAPATNFNAVADERLARELVEQRKAEEKDKANAPITKVSLENLFSQMQEGEMKELNIIVKADVQGSVEAVKAVARKALQRRGPRARHPRRASARSTSAMSCSRPRPTPSSSASTSVRTPPARGSAERDKCRHAHVPRHLRRHRRDRGRYEGYARARSSARPSSATPRSARPTRSPSVGTVAGCYVTGRQDPARDATCVWCATASSSTRASSPRCSASRTPSRKSPQGYECGMTLEKFNDIKVGDIVEAYVMEQIEQ